MTPTLSAQVPLPNEPLPSLSNGGYGRSGPPDVMVRIDVTYLRQDFSLLMPVHDAAPWPDMQRFDFLVRSRVLSPKEAEEFRQNAPKAVAGSTTPYQRRPLRPPRTDIARHRPHPASLAGATGIAEQDESVRNDGGRTTLKGSHNAAQGREAHPWVTKQQTQGRFATLGFDIRPYQGRGTSACWPHHAHGPPATSHKKIMRLTNPTAGRVSNACPQSLQRCI